MTDADRTSPLVAEESVSEPPPPSTDDDLEKTPSFAEQVSASVLSLVGVAPVGVAPVDVVNEEVDGSYVNAEAGVADVGNGKDPFDGVRGTVQPPKYKDLKYAIAFALHFGIAIWWFVDSFIPYRNGYYTRKLKHSGLLAFVTAVGIFGTGLAFLVFSYMLRNGETILKTSVLFATIACGAVGVLGMFFAEGFMFVSGLVGFAIVGTYSNMVWGRIPFTATNLAVAIDAVRANMGLFLAAMSVAAVAYVWLFVAVTAGVNGYRWFGKWTMVYTIFSYYWTQQVLTNVISVATAGIVGRWFVTGEKTPKYTAALKETMAIARTHSFGCICFGSLFSGIVQIFSGLRSFLRSKRVPFLPNVLDWFLRKINCVIDDTNEMAYVYVGMYGYSYTAGAKNATLLLQTRGWDGIARDRLAGNILFILNLTIGLLTGFCGLMFGTFEYGMMRKGGLYSPDADGFFIGFLVGFLFSSIILSIVTAAIHTLIVCLAESPAEFKANHPELFKMMDSVWTTKTKKGRSLF